MHFLQTNQVVLQCAANIEETVFTINVRQLTNVIQGEWPKLLNATYNKSIPCQ